MNDKQFLEKYGVEYADSIPNETPDEEIIYDSNGGCFSPR